MNSTLLAWLMALCFVAALALVALGLPGLWLMVLAVIAYGGLTDFRTIGLWTIVTVAALAAIGEIFEAWLGFGLRVHRVIRRRCDLRVLQVGRRRNRGARGVGRTAWPRRGDSGQDRGRRRDCGRVAVRSDQGLSPNPSRSTNL